MSHFFDLDLAFRTYRSETKAYGLGSFELMLLALLKMRTGKPWLEIEADMGALNGKGRLSRAVRVWIHRLGSFSKQSLVGLVEAEYMDEHIPAWTIRGNASGLLTSYSAEMNLIHEGEPHFGAGTSGRTRRG